jgi:hypothetical protein
MHHRVGLLSSFSPRKACGAEEYTNFSFCDFGNAERTEPLFCNEFFYATKSQYFSIGRTITFIRVLSCGISAVVTDFF